jgi:prepilin-type N-terminal cleavage/methylation domain-containing protein
MRACLRNQQGLTLVEVLLATAIIGIGLTALAAAIPMAAYGIHEGNHLSTATFLADQRLEQIRNAPWEQGAPCNDKVGVSASATSPPTSTCPGAVVTFADETPLPAPYAAYSRTTRITNCGAGAGCSGIVHADLRQVTVTVTYRPMTGRGLSPTGTAKVTSVSMYVAKR